MSESAMALPAECVETGPTTVKCSYTDFSVSKEFVVPAGVTSIQARAVGAPGESAAGLAGPTFGGRGAIVTAELAVTPGSTLTAFPATKRSPDRGLGGCKPGGGASGLRTGPLLADRILVAGGGGGAGCGIIPAVGGDAGSPGGPGVPAGPGGAGTQTSGGAGGSPGGSSGSFGQGGAGGAGTNGGGGGGGGWYGGGGGGGTTEALGRGGGGGGGSSLVPAGGTLALHEARLSPGVVHPSSAVVEIEYSTVPPAAPGASVSPTSVDFGAQTVGTTSAAQAVTLSSTGTAPLAVGSVSIAGANPGDFTKSSDNCSGKTLAGGESCTVAVTFKPSATGARTATLSFADNASNSPQTVTLSGTGTQPLADLGISLSATPNPVKVSATLTYAIAVVNRGPATATNVAVVDALPSAAQFASIAVPAGWSCTTPPVGNTGKVTCKTSAMASGATASLTLKVTVVSSGKSTVSNTVTVASDASDTNPADNEATATTSVQGRR